MSIDIKLKHSSIQDRAPVPTDLVPGELALNINSASPAAYIKDSAGNIVKLAGAGSAGDLWERTGTDLSPKTNGDSLQLKNGSGTVSVDLDAGAAGTPLVRTSTGRLGLGSSSPEQLLHISSTGEPTLRIQDADLTNRYVDISQAGGATFFRSRADASNGSFIFSGFGGGTDDEFVRIDSDGKVGIGVASPAAKVQLSVGNSPTTDQADTLAVRGTAGTWAGHIGATSEGGAFIARGNAAVKGQIVFGNTDGSYTNYVETARIDASGRLLVGTSSTIQNRQIESANTSGNNYGAYRFSANNGGSDFWFYKSRGATVGSHGLVSNNDVAGSIQFSLSDGSAYSRCASIEVAADGAPAVGSMPGRFSFNTTPSGSTTPVERMRIGSSGDQAHFSNVHAAVYSTAYAPSSSNVLFYGRHSATAVTTGTDCIVIRSNGNVQNTNNSYTGISDIKLKENIVDAKSQWDDIKGLRVVNYNFKKETGAETFKQLGLIAQEVEKVCPGLVGETKDMETVEVPVLDADGNPVLGEDGKPQVSYEERETGEVTKNVNYSILYMKAVGALQEALVRIEQLEAKVTALEGGAPAKSSDPGTKTRR